jgi:serine/threonine protein kinase
MQAGASMHINNFRIIAQLGQGGMGKVYLALNAAGERVVLKHALVADSTHHQRLREEAMLGLAVQHPHVVRTLGCVESPEHGPVVVTAFVHGVSLLDVREHCGALPPAMVCAIGRDVAHALDAIHNARTATGTPLHAVHRDVSASNLLLPPTGEVSLIDMGISRMDGSAVERTKTGFLRGTLRYLAPELFDARGASVQSDLWSLGVVMAELLLGRSITRGSEIETMGKICTGHLLTLQDGEQPHPRVWSAIEKLTQLDPRERPARARDVAALLGMMVKELAPPQWNMADTAAAVVETTRANRRQKRHEEHFARTGTPLTDGTASSEIMQRAHASEVPAEELVLQDVVTDAASQTTTNERAKPNQSPNPMSVSATTAEAILDYRAHLQQLERS